MKKLVVGFAFIFSFCVLLKPTLSSASMRGLAYIAKSTAGRLNSFSYLSKDLVAKINMRDGRVGQKLHFSHVAHDAQKNEHQEKVQNNGEALSKEVCKDYQATAQSESVDDGNAARQIYVSSKEDSVAQAEIHDQRNQASKQEKSSKTPVGSMTFVNWARSKKEGILPCLPENATGIYAGIATRQEAHDLINYAIADLNKELRDETRPLYKGIVNDNLRSSMTLPALFSYDKILQISIAKFGAEKGVLVAERFTKWLVEHGYKPKNNTNTNQTNSQNSKSETKSEANESFYKKNAHGLLVGVPVGALFGGASVMAYYEYLNRKKSGGTNIVVVAPPAVSPIIPVTPIKPVSPVVPINPVPSVNPINPQPREIENPKPQEPIQVVALQDNNHQASNPRSWKVMTAAGAVGFGLVAAITKLDWSTVFSAIVR